MFWGHSQLNWNSAIAVPRQREWQITDGGINRKLVSNNIISQPVCRIPTKLQRLSHVIGVQQLIGTLAESARRNRKPRIQDGDH